MLHLLFLHETGSNNPLGLNSDGEKVPFHSYYSFKDLVGFVIILFLLSLLVLFSPQLLTDPENMQARSTSCTLQLALSTRTTPAQSRLRPRDNACQHLTDLGHTGYCSAMVITVC